jgi:hypothetical protein
MRSQLTTGAIPSELGLMTSLVDFYLCNQLPRCHHLGAGVADGSDQA